MLNSPLESGWGINAAMPCCEPRWSGNARSLARRWCDSSGSMKPLRRASRSTAAADAQWQATGDQWSATGYDGVAGSAGYRVPRAGCPSTHASPEASGGERRFGFRSPCRAKVEAKSNRRVPLRSAAADSPRQASRQRAPGRKLRAGSTLRSDRSENLDIGFFPYAENVLRPRYPAPKVREGAERPQHCLP